MTSTIAVAASSHGPGVTLAGEAGARLLDLCDEARAPIPFSCRGATCGTCRVRVLSGAELLQPAEVAERETLALFGDDDDVRLACVVRLAGGAGGVRLALADDELPTP